MHLHFSVLGQEKIASLISTDDQSMFVMDNSTMRWATQLPFSPLVIKRGSFRVGFRYSPIDKITLFWIINYTYLLIPSICWVMSFLKQVDQLDDDGANSSISHHNLIVLLSKSGDIFAGLYKWKFEIHPVLQNYFSKY